MICHKGPSGIACPEAGTRGTQPGTGDSPQAAVEYEVITSSCTRNDYTPRCDRQPYYPLGICLCTKRGLSGRFLGTDACDVTELDVVAPQGTETVPIMIQEIGNTTYTNMSRSTDLRDTPDYTASVQVTNTTFAEPDTGIRVSLQINEALVLEVSEVSEEPEDYAYLLEEYYSPDITPPTDYTGM